jgi:hypothetical protein
MRNRVSITLPHGIAELTDFVDQHACDRSSMHSTLENRSIISEQSDNSQSL